MTQKNALKISASSQVDPEELFSGGGEMGALMRRKDWAATQLGPLETWSPALRMMAKFLLANRFPLLLWWGPDFCQLYNDAYRPILGTKHPHFLGEPVRECWSEIWHILEPLIRTPFEGGPATWMEDIPLEINRYGFMEETHFTIAYSPVPDESAPRGIGGVLATVHEISEKVVGERRTRALRDLGAGVLEERSAEEACARAGDVLASYPKDVPFSLVYLLDDDRHSAHLACTSGIDEDERISPQVITMQTDDPAVWPLSKVLESGDIEVVENLSSRGIVVPAGPWADPPDRAAVVPVHSNIAHQLAGFFIAGLSSRLRFDDSYRGFLELTSAQIATTVANARAYEEEKKRAEALAEIDRAKTAFFTNISHEFRTPLTLLLTPIEETLAKPNAHLGEDERERLEMAQRNGVRLLKLVNTLLDFSRIEAGRLHASYEPVDICALTRDMASMFRSAIERAGLALMIECEPVEEFIYVDREMWEKVVLNLLSNAFKFTFDGSICVRLENKDDHVELAVSDSGTGIPEEELPRLFERFYRVEGARGRTFEGSGIGLALVQELVKLHGGTVTAESELGKGSTFRVSIPKGKAHLPKEHIDLSKEVSSAGPTAHRVNSYVAEALKWIPSRLQQPTEFDSEEMVQSQQPEDAQKQGGEKPTILLADDNTDMRDYVRNLLEQHYRVMAVSNGLEALQVLEKSSPDLILTDVMMPGLDGFGLLRAVRGKPEISSTPVIFLSARAGEEAGIEGRDAGADDYLVKPFSARELIARVGAHLKLRRVRENADALVRDSEKQLRRSEAELRELNAQLKRELDAGMRMQQLSTRLVQIDDFRELLSEILNAAIDISHADMGNIQMLEDNALKILVQSGFEEPFLKFFDAVHEGSSACGTALKQRDRVVVEDVTQSSIFIGSPALDVLMAAGVRSVQSTPLIGHFGEVLGMISTHYRSPYHPHESELRAMDILARLAGELIERHRIQKSKGIALIAAQQLAAIVESSDDAIASKDLNGIVTSWNKSAERLFGYTANEIIGKPITTIIPPELLSDEDMILGKIRKGQRIEHFETIRITKSGERIEVSLSISPVRNEEGRIIGAAKVVRDITQKKKIERALRTTEKLAAAGRLAATVAHEINNPLEAVHNLVFLAKRDVQNSEKVAQYLQMAQRELDRVAHIARQTLGFYRDTSAPTRFSVAKTLDDLLFLYEKRLEVRGIRVVKQYEDQGEITALAGEIRQALSNLISNAIDAMPTGGSLCFRVSKSHAWVNSQQPGVRVTVLDTGTGISVQARKKLFEPFFTTKADVGTGLGLWITKNIVEKHHGYIRFTSRTGTQQHGTAFSIFLPLNNQAESPEQTQHRDSPRRISA